MRQANRELPANEDEKKEKGEGKALAVPSPSRCGGDGTREVARVGTAISDPSRGLRPTVEGVSWCRDGQSEVFQRAVEQPRASELFQARQSISRSR